MKSMIAVLAALAVIGCAAAVVMSDAETDAITAQGTETVEIYSTDSDGKYVVVYINESAYEELTGASIEWAIVETNSSYDITDAVYTNVDGAKFQENKISVSFSNLSDVNSDKKGAYALKFTTDNASGTHYFVLKATISYIDSQDESVNLTPIYYQITLEVTDMGSFPSEFKSVNVYVNTSYPNPNKKINISTNDGDTSIDVSKYYWFAYGMPAGLVMLSDGSIAGMAKEKTKEGEPANVNVIATDKVTGVRYTATMKVTVSDDPSVFDDELTFSIGESELAGVYYVESGGTVEVTVSNQSNTVKVLTYSIVNNGKAQVIPGTGNEVEFNVSGMSSGQYRVIVTAEVTTTNGSVHIITDHFDLYVIGNVAGGLEAGMVVSGSGAPATT